MAAILSLHEQDALYTEKPSTPRESSDASTADPLERDRIMSTDSKEDASETSAVNDFLSRAPFLAEWSNGHEERRAFLREMQSSIKTERVLELGSHCTCSCFGDRFHMSIPSEGSGLKCMVEQITQRGAAPVDVVLISVADKGLPDLFDVIWHTPDFLSDDGVVCIDVAAFEGEKTMDILRDMVETSPDKVAVEIEKLLVVQRSTYAGPY